MIRFIICSHECLCNVVIYTYIMLAFVTISPSSSPSIPTAASQVCKYLLEATVWIMSTSNFHKLIKVPAFVYLACAFNTIETLTTSFNIIVNIVLNIVLYLELPLLGSLLIACKCLYYP